MQKYWIIPFAIAAIIIFTVLTGSTGLIMGILFFYYYVYYLSDSGGNKRK